jgi:hypothetical protein
MEKTRTALLGAIFAFCACASAQTTPGPTERGASATEKRLSPDPAIAGKPPANVDPQAIERPPANVDRKNRKSAPPPPVAMGGPDLPSVIVVPHGQPTDAALGKGCWVRFYDDKAYGGRSLTLVGPVQMPKMNIPGGLWVNWGSVVVGPNATVTTFDYEQFKDPTAVLHPRQRISDLKDRKLGSFEDIHSLRIACNAGRKR